MAAAKKVAAKKAAPAAAPKKASTAKAAPAGKAKAKPIKEADDGKAAEKAEKEAQRAKELAEVGERRANGEKWAEIADALGISIGKAQLLGQIHEAQSKGNLKKATPALVKRDRDDKKMSWVAIAVQYGLTKAQTQRLYREAGGDPNSSYVGKGGRYFSHEDAIAGQRDVIARAKAAERKEKAVGKPKAKKDGAAKASAPAKPIFADDVDADTVKAKISGKTITVVANVKGVDTVSTLKVKPESVKVGKQKDGTRVVQFTEVNGGTRTVRLSGIVKAA